MAKRTDLWPIGNPDREPLRCRWHTRKPHPRAVTKITDIGQNRFDMSFGDELRGRLVAIVPNGVRSDTSRLPYQALPSVQPRPRSP